MSASVTQATPSPSPFAPPDLRRRLHALAPSDAKVRRPSSRPGLVSRPALVERVRGREPVVVLSAPAGYGKTTLLTQWADAEDRPVAWLTVTAGDNDLTTLVAYVVRTLDEVEPFAPETLAAITASGAHGSTVLLPRLGRALLERKAPFLLALDDVHVLTDPECLNALAVLVTHLPPGSQLALATRQDPPLARARLRARGTLVEIRAEDLTLSGAEGEAVLRDAGLDVDRATAGALIARTEGWPAGLYLAALAARTAPDAGAVARRFSGDHRVVAEYLRDEILDGLPDDVVEFLIRSSVLEYLDGPGCDAVLERDGSWAVLDELARSNLFVVPLDNTGEQYRYHHLFADLLHTELRRREPNLVPDLHRRASALFAARHQPNLAIQHAHAAGEVALAAALVWREVVPYLGAGRGSTVERWLAMFDPDEVARDPHLVITSTWCSIATPNPRPIGDWLDLLRHFDPDVELADGTPFGAMAALLDAVAGQGGVGAMVISAAQANALVPPGSGYHYLACFLEGAGLLLTGEVEAARDRLEDAAVGRSVIPGPASCALGQLAMLAADREQWSEAGEYVERGLDLMREHHLMELPLQVATFAVAALVAARDGDRDTARRHANHARRLVSLLGRQVGPWLAAEVLVVLGHVELLLGDPEAARLLAREARDLTARMPDAGVLPDRIAELSRAVDAEVQAGSELRAAPLTTAELRVLAYLPTHLSFQAMAEDLFVSRNTVKTQAIAIYRKLGVSSRGDAVARARELGLLES